MIEAVKNEGKKLIEMSGKFKSISTGKTGVVIETDTFNYDLIFYDKNIVRVHQKNGFNDTNPYSVIKDPKGAEFSIDESDDSIVIVSEELDIAVDKSQMLITFLTKEGKVINKDEEGLGTMRQGEQVTVYKTLQEGERFVGLGEKTGPLDRKGKGYINWNTDHFAYEVDADPLYASIPFYIGIHNQLSYGIFVDNSHKSQINFGASNCRFSSFSVDAGDMDYYFFSGSVEQIIESYTWLTGRMSIPPLWSIGYQQCRYSYYPDTEVLDVAKKFRDKEIPADVIVLDIHYMEKYKIFTWDKDRFPYPDQMVDLLKEMGFEVVVICDPGIKKEEGYKPYEEGLKNDIFLKYPDGMNYEGEVWPGWCNFPDFTNKNARTWWAEMMKSYTDIGIKGFWNDMNEIATWGQMLPDNIKFSFEGEDGTTRKGRNIYGMMMAKSSFEGARSNLNGKRPFNLTRAAFSGVQRYGALWTGDNVANDEHMLLGVRLVNSLGLSGVAFSGYDVGGFAGNGQSKLFARWIQLGAFSPFFRGHSMINSHDSEPWSYGEEVEEISKNYIRLRYKLMPYVYSGFLMASEKGHPINRSLSIDYSHDEMVYEPDFENQYLFGRSILVAPVRSDSNFNKIYLPEGEWFDFFTDQKHHGNKELVSEYALEHLPLFVKSSAIIPVYPNARHNSAEIGEVLELHIYKGDESNEFDYYEDDGTTYHYESGNFHRRTVLYNPSEKMVVLSDALGSYKSKIQSLRLIFHGFEKQDFSDDFYQNLQAESYAFVAPISNFDPFEKELRDNLKIENVFSFETSYSNEKMDFSL